MKFAALFVPFFNVVYVVLALIMIGLILMQRGAGAQAGSSFGAGASGTVFGARGSANFLSRATSICAALFFLISFGMGVYIAHSNRAKPEATAPSLMDSFGAAPATTTAPATPAAASEVPSTGLPAATTTPAPLANAPISTPAAVVPVPAEAAPITATANPQPNAEVPAPQK